MKFSLKLDGKNIEIETNSLAEQANGSALVRSGDTLVLATAVMGKEDREDLGFFPLTVEYQERYYASGKIKGSRFIKREGRPSDEAICNSRLIDRSIRPRFPQELAKEVQVITTVLSLDGENDPDLLALIAASVSLSISNIPWQGPLGVARVCQKDNKLIVNPSYKEREGTNMDILLVGLYSGKEFLLNMIEGEFKEVNEKEILAAYDLAEKHIKKLLEFQKEIQKKEGKEKIILSPALKHEEVDKEILNFIGDKFVRAFFQKDKNKRTEDTNLLKKELGSLIKEKYPEEEIIKYAMNFLDKQANKLVKDNALEHDKRIDGRKMDEIRKITSRVGIIPRVHGTGLFSRGQTKSMSIVTLGSPGDKQLIEGMEIVEKKRLMHHYNFPPYSVGETGFLRGPGRREIGHGALAEKALKYLIPDESEFPYTIRIVTEILSSNGSTSMASVSSSALALMDAGVPIKRLATGIAIGLIKDEGKYKVMTDIQGEEDHHGGMDFKVAGTKKGITVMQMDVKVDGINREILAEVLEKAKKARTEILEIMEKTISEPRSDLSKYAPRILTMQINPSKIGEIIGPGGKIINKIIDETGAQIDIEDSGQIFVTSEDSKSAQKAIDWINDIVAEAEVGKIYEGEVKRILEFGAFVEILPGKDGLIHISKLSDKRVEKVEDVIQMGDKVSVKVISIDDQGRINLKLIKK